MDLVINYKETPDFSEAVKNFTGKRGVDVILDHIGAKYLEPNMNSLAYAGRLVLIGVTSGIKAELNLGLMMVKRQRIIGSVLRSRPVAEKGEIVAEFTRRALPSHREGISPRGGAGSPPDDGGGQALWENRAASGRIIG